VITNDETMIMLMSMIMNMIMNILNSL